MVAIVGTFLAIAIYLFFGLGIAYLFRVPEPL